MHHRQIVRLAIFARELAGLLQRLAGDDGLGAMAPGVLDLHHRRADRHHDAGGNAEPVRVIGDALGVIARRHRDHAAPPLVRRQRDEPVQRTALLEAGGELQVLEFEPEVAAADLGERPALVAFSDNDGAADGRGGGDHVSGRDGEAGEAGRLLVRQCWLADIWHYEGLVEGPSYKPFPPSAPPQIRRARRRGWRRGYRRDSRPPARIPSAVPSSRSPRRCGGSRGW